MTEKCVFRWVFVHYSYMFALYFLCSHVRELHRFHWAANQAGPAEVHAVQNPRKEFPQMHEVGASLWHHLPPGQQAHWCGAFASIGRTWLPDSEQPKEKNSWCVVLFYYSFFFLFILMNLHSNVNVCMAPLWPLHIPMRLKSFCFVTLRYTAVRRSRRKAQCEYVKNFFFIII